MVEITLTVPRALEVISELARRYPNLAVRAGTVLDAHLEQRSIDAGARFLTCPGFVPEMVACATKADVVVSPGAFHTDILAPDSGPAWDQPPCGRKHFSRAAQL